MLPLDLLDVKQLPDLLAVLVLHVPRQVLYLLLPLQCFGNPRFKFFYQSLVLVDFEYKDEDSPLRVLQSVLLKALLDAVRRVHVIDYLISEGACLHLAISNINYGSGDSYVEMHQGGHMFGIDESEILLMCAHYFGKL